jgi:hypothetical protein
MIGATSSAPMRSPIHHASHEAPICAARYEVAEEQTRDANRRADRGADEGDKDEPEYRAERLQRSGEAWHALQDVETGHGFERVANAACERDEH